MIEKPLDSCQRFKINSEDSSIKQIKDRCRICLQEQQPLISLPCNCKDQLGKVHKKCYGKWIFIHDPMIGGNKTLIQCQICRQYMQIELSIKTGIKSCKQINQQNDFQIKMVLCLQIILVLLLTSLFIIVIINNQKLKIQVMVGVMFLAILSIGCLLKKMYNFIIKKQIKQFNFIQTNPINNN